MRRRNSKTCADCQHGEFVSVSSLHTPPFEVENEKLCIYCKLLGFNTRTDRPMCRKGLPENRTQYFRSLGLMMVDGYLIPNNLDEVGTRKALQRARQSEQMYQRNLIKKKNQKEINKESVELAKT